MAGKWSSSPKQDHWEWVWKNLCCLLWAHSVLTEIRNWCLWMAKYWQKVMWFSVSLCCWDWLITLSVHQSRSQLNRSKRLTNYGVNNSEILTLPCLVTSWHLLCLLRICWLMVWKEGDKNWLETPNWRLVERQTQSLGLILKYVFSELLLNGVIKTWLSMQ